MRGNENINGHPIRCYDIGESANDRYTVVYMDSPEPRGMFQCLGMNAHPFHPQGFGQHSAATIGHHLGKRVAFADLPQDCQRAVLQDLKAETV